MKLADLVMDQEFREERFMLTRQGLNGDLTIDEDGVYLFFVPKGDFPGWRWCPTVEDLVSDGWRKS